MKEWFLEHWIKLAFGGITTLITAMFAYFKKYYKKGLEAAKTEENNKIVNEIKNMLDKQSQEFANQLNQQSQDFSKQFADQKKDFNQQLGTISAHLEDLEQRFNVLNDGVLSIQKEKFMNTCHRLLEEGHTITLQEFENLVKDHKVYNSLGGNSDGDLYFNLVKDKYAGEVSH